MRRLQRRKDGRCMDELAAQAVIALARTGGTVMARAGLCAIMPAVNGSSAAAPKLKAARRALVSSLECAKRSGEQQWPMGANNWASKANNTRQRLTGHRQPLRGFGVTQPNCRGLCKPPDRTRDPLLR